MISPGIIRSMSEKSVLQATGGERFGDYSGFLRFLEREEVRVYVRSGGGEGRATLGVCSGAG